MDTPQGLGPYLTGLRERRGWTLTEAAERLDMGKSHLSQLEGGKIGLPNAALRRRMADTFGIRHVDLLVAAGELTEAEIAPLPISFIADFRLQEIVTAWSTMKPELRSALHSSIRAISNVPGMRDDDEAPIVALSR